MDDIRIDYADVLKDLKDYKTKETIDVLDYVEIRDIEPIVKISVITIVRRARYLEIPIKKMISPRSGRQSNFVSKEDAKKIIKELCG